MSVSVNTGEMDSAIQMIMVSHEDQRVILQDTTNTSPTVAPPCKKRKNNPR